MPTQKHSQMTVLFIFIKFHICLPLEEKVGFALQNLGKVYKNKAVQKHGF